jgi:xanthine dehydrogenase iron-sulfur cluster and FAD-binding subunit A
MWHDYYCVTTLDEAIDILVERGERARIVAGATDLILEIERGVRTGIDTLIDITRVPNLDQISLDEDGTIHMGALVTHNHCAASKLIVERAFPLARAAWEVGAPQIRNRGTVAGNLITASPANDTITPLMALGAKVSLRSKSGARVVPLEQFYTGVRRSVMRPDEILVDIFFPAMQPNQRGTFIKLGLRRAQAISLVNAAIMLTFQDGRVEKAAITLGAVAPTIIHAAQAETYLAGRSLDESSLEEAARLAEQAARPIGDVRSSADYRSEMVRVCTLRSLRQLAAGTEKADYPEEPVLLWGKDYQGAAPVLSASAEHKEDLAIVTRINGVQYSFTSGQDKTLLRLLREEAGLIGTKEGCAEGECGACTVFLDGVAVMSCLVPAPRAHGAEIVTVEGLASDGHLHPVQQAFIEAGAVQCGYCTPGFLMSAAKLLEENPLPSRGEIQQAITGNLCRCTGYYTIVNAIDRAAQIMEGR